MIPQEARGTIKVLAIQQKNLQSYTNNKVVHHLNGWPLKNLPMIPKQKVQRFYQIMFQA